MAHTWRNIVDMDKNVRFSALPTKRVFFFALISVQSCLGWNKKRSIFFKTVQLERNVASISKGGVIQDIQVYSQNLKIWQNSLFPHRAIITLQVFFISGISEWFRPFLYFFSTNNFQAVSNYFISKLHLSQKKGF